MDIAISGSSGLIGRALASALVRDGHRVVRLVRPETEGTGGDTVAWDPRSGAIDRAGLEGVDAVVNLAGAGVGSGRWTAGRKRELFRSRVRGTHVLARTLAALQAPPAVFVSGSAVGYYGDRGDRELTESDGPGSGFLPEVARAWEEAAAPARDAGIRTVLLRSAHVLAPHGGLLPYLVTPFRLGLGARFGDGRQWFPWVTLEDEVGAIRFAIEERSVHGPVNAAAPEPVTNRALTATLARVLRRPAPWWAPAPVLRALVGAERADQVLLWSAKVVPGALLRAGFSFADPQLEPALRRLLDVVPQPAPSAVT
ncbi:MAG TPA: TIGR01777 family oxidoreductase [Actinomycetota bacterium]|nr:TIGR01777 family oxidoreductase [Actinomycetota bacterium]